MIWYVLRHFRAAYLAVAAGTIVVMVVLLVEHAVLLTDPAARTTESCSLRPDSSCLSTLSQFASRFAVLTGPGVEWMLLLPAMAGLFLGAPLVSRELESGTYRFVWTQGVTRLRWFGVTAVGHFVVVALAFALLGVTANWALDPVLEAQDLTLTGSRLASPAYDALGLLPVAFAVFALASGILAGTVLRRTLVAMLVTILILAAARVPFALFLRPVLAAPVTAVADPNVSAPYPVSVPPGSLVVDTGLMDAHGNVIRLLPSCGPTVSTDQALEECYKERGYRSFVTYEPASRLGPVQEVEGAAFLLAAAMAVCAAALLIRYRIS